MPIVTIVVGSLLSLLGVGGYLLSESRSLTALIPFVFGTLLEACGALAFRPRLKAHAMHAASVLALLGVLGSASGAIAVIRLVSAGSGDFAAPLAAVVRTAMFVICLVFLALCIRSFRQARARRQAEAAARA